MLAEPKMPLPALNSNGLLPPGLYRASTSEIREMYCWNAHRQQLFIQLAAFLGVLRTEFTERVLVDGSFVTDKELPDDIDVVLDMRVASSQRAWEASEYCRKRQAEFLNKYRVSVWPNLPASNDFAAFFQYLGTKSAAMKNLHPKHLKGIIEVS